MSCGCSQTPCSCPPSAAEPLCNPTCDTDTTGEYPGVITLCDLDRRNNVWVEGADAEGNGGICLLDTLEEHQIINSLQRSERAKTDLLKVTSNQYLIDLANKTPQLPTTNEGDQAQKELNQNSIPFYSIFRGQPPFAQ